MGSDHNGGDETIECNVLPLANLSCNYPKCLDYASEIFGHSNVEEQGLQSDIELIVKEYNKTAGSLIEFQCTQPSHRFKLKDDSSAEKITYNCTFPGFTDENGIQYSKWKWYDNGEWLIEPPNCYMCCKDDPAPEEPPTLARTWDKLHWTDSELYYSCRQDLAFDLIHAKRRDKLHFECKWDEEGKSAKWTYTWKDIINGTEVPECLDVCTKDPPKPFDNQTRHWINGNHVLGKTANYTCDFKDDVMKTRLTYKEISMVCSLSPTNSTQWVWMDENSTTMTIPECKPGPKCLPIQEELGPSNTFDPKYIISEDGSFFKPLGEYLNDSSIVGTTLNLSCGFEGEYINVSGETMNIITIECKYNPDTEESYWSWFSSISNSEERVLPECKMQCSDQPYARSDLRRHWSLRRVSFQCKVFQNLTQMFFVDLGGHRSQVLVCCKRFIDSKIRDQRFKVWVCILQRVP